MSTGENPRLVLKAGREKSLKRKHFWVFSGAVAEAPTCESGATVDIISASGEFLAVGGYSPTSQIIARVWSFSREAVNEQFFRRRIRAAQELRDRLGIPGVTSAYRLISAEGDAIPGVVVDIYGDHAIIQILSAAAEARKSQIVSALAAELPGLVGIYERSDVAVRAKEGLKECTGVLWGEPPPQEFIVREHSYSLIADPYCGHKTGFYFDQRVNRKLVGEYADGRSVLNLFSYSGGFGVAAALGGAVSVENVDSSAAALELARRNMELNGIPEDRFVNTCANVFELLRQYEKEKRRFGVIVLDPPKLVEGQAHLMKGCRAYKELALRAFRLLEPNGLLFTFSCSGLVTPELFAKLSFDAASDAGVFAAIVAKLGQDMDHPVLLNHPESAYLKGLAVLRRDI